VVRSCCCNVLGVHTKNLTSWNGMASMASFALRIISKVHLCIWALHDFATFLAGLQIIFDEILFGYSIFQFHSQNIFLHLLNSLDFDRDLDLQSDLQPVLYNHGCLACFLWNLGCVDVLWIFNDNYDRSTLLKASKNFNQLFKGEDNLNWENKNHKQ
jgi:hypothetical protein